MHSRIATETRKKVTVREEGSKARKRERKRERKIIEARRRVELLSLRLFILSPSFLVLINIKEHCIFIFHDISIIITGVSYNVK